MIGATSFANVTGRSERGDAVCAAPTTGCNAKPTKNAGRAHLLAPKRLATFIVILPNPAEAGSHVFLVRLKPDPTLECPAEAGSHVGVSGFHRTCTDPTLVESGF